MIEDFIERKVDYVVLEQLGYSSTGLYLYPTVKKYPMKFKLLLHYKNPDTYLMKFMPELGYWGDWRPVEELPTDSAKTRPKVETIREGYGTFDWGNGQKYSGGWYNNRKHGEGIMRIPGPDSNSITGNWVNDTLSGLVILKSKDGKVLEKSIYENNIKIKILSE
jgi:hypothetical protein